MRRQKAEPRRADEQVQNGAERIGWPEIRFRCGRRAQCLIFWSTRVAAMEHYLIVLEPSATGYAAFSPDVPGCVATGASVEQTLAEMRGALAFHLEGMTLAGESLPTPKGLEYHVQSGEHIADPGDLLTTIPADELLLVVSVIHAA